MSYFFTNVSLAKDNILLCGYRDGQRVREEVPYKPYLFVGSRGTGDYHTLDEREVSKIEFDSISEARKFVEDYKDVNNFQVYGMNQFIYPFIFDEFPGEIDYDQSQISVCSIDIEVDIADEKGFPDIQEANNEITLITIARNGMKTVFGCQAYTTQREDVKFVLCKDEVELLTKFLRTWNSPEYSPDVITGWNIEFFDIPYIINRIIRILGKKAAQRLSPWNFIRDRKVARAYSTEEDQVWEIVGVTILDYMQLYKKFGYSIQESYSLDHIAYVELGERKLDYGEYGSLAGLQTGNWSLYVDYNIKDVDLVDKLDDKLGLIGLVLAMAYDAKVNYQDTFTTVRAWDVIIHNYLLERKVVVPQLQVPDYNEGIIGGYVKDPQVGLHEWVVSFDLASLYPHIIMQYNISPETYFGRFPAYPGGSVTDQIDKMFDGMFRNTEYRQYLLDNDVTVTANMLHFKRDKQGFLPALMSKYYAERTIYKNKMIEAQKALEQVEDKKSSEAQKLVKDISRYNNLQMAKKIQINSAYGALANRFFRWHRAEFGEAITASGQLTTRWAERALNQYLNKALKTIDMDYVIACDTDSVYIRLGPLVDQIFTKEQQEDKQKVTKFLDNLCSQKLKACIDTAYDDLCDYVNAVDNKMNMKRECIADKGIWTAKKRYILNVYNKEGVAYAQPKLKMMGIEAIRTSTPQVCRDAIKEALVVIMNKTESELQSFVKDFLLKFETLPFEEVASPRSVSDMESYADASSIFRKGTPINAKGALIYNHYLKKLKLDKKYEAINSGQKIKYAYCVQPNPLNCTVIAAPGGKLPSEFGMDRYIDRYKQYNKSFLEPIKTITNAIGWQVEKKATLESFFGY